MRLTLGAPSASSGKNTRSNPQHPYDGRTRRLIIRQERHWLGA
jgi:hypothetical protein